MSRESQITKALDYCSMWLSEKDYESIKKILKPKMISEMGLDLDFKDIKFHLDRIHRIGRIIQKYPTKKGWHIRVKFTKPQTFEGYINLRDFCGDDPRRIVKDYLRYCRGLPIDLLFTYKKKGWFEIRMEKQL